ncbi:hypothetical protein JCM16303_005903 [Sporobolomyces ruberrimus]
MPYARRHQLTPRQRQILGTLQRTSVPTSVAVQVVNNNPHSRPGVTSTPPLGTPSTKRDASIDTTTRSNEDAQPFESRGAVTGAGETPGEERLGKEGDRVTTLSQELVSNGAQQADSDDSNKIMPRDLGQREQTSARPCSKRSDSQTEFQIVQRGVHGNIVLLSNESPDAQPIELLSSSAVLSRDQRSTELSETAEEDWELLSYEEEDINLEAKRFDDTPRLVSATA